MGYKVIITGSTGMVGKGVLLECIDHPQIAEIVLLNRRPVEIDNSKITEIIHDDFEDFSALSEKLTSADACFFCLGISSIGKSEEEYKRVTYDITLNLARTLSNINPEMIFCYVSGAGTNATGRLMWSRVKGRTELDLLKLPFKKVVWFRPGIIQPLRGIRSPYALNNIFYTIASPFLPALKIFPNAITNTSNVGRAMINCLKTDQHPQALENRDINKLANEVV